MRLSEAIRLGSMLGPKASGQFYKDGATCAAGSALLAMGRTPEQFENNIESHDVLLQHWPWIRTVKVDCPACGKPMHVWGLIPHLNNNNAVWSIGNHDWTRERIADHIELIERLMELQSPAAGEAPTVVSVSPVSDAEDLITVRSSHVPVQSRARSDPTEIKRRLCANGHS
jgi:hypothetical protein